MKNTGKVFVSHSSKDKAFVDHIVSDLAAHQISVWYDKLDIKIGDSIPGKINAGLSDAKYFLIVLSPDSVTSLWVQEELNAALMRQITSNGTFLIPILFRDCEIPPLLAHRRYVDFRSNYNDGLTEILSLWGKDTEAVSSAGNKPLFPWPDLDVPDTEFVYLYSTRFDKFFRMNCELSWTVDYTIDYITSVLDLPWNKELPNLGMQWSFSYGLVFGNEKISLSKTLHDVGICNGSTLQISISGTYEDLYEKELKAMWDGSKMYEVTGAIRRETMLRQAIEDRGSLTSERLREIAKSCFAHV
jgi:hypothetical protein